jgi:phytoene synthase
MKNNQEMMRLNGRTFFWATRFLSKDEVEDIATLYAFCRFVDDLVDIRGASCEQIQQDLQKQNSTFEPVRNLLKMASKRKMSLEPALILVRTLDKDRKGTRIQTWGELLRYCYGVASTVGLMMCDIFGVQNKNAYPFAIDLGIGMQLTNISRDIREDAVQDKIYIPQEAFKKGVTVTKILQGKEQEELIVAEEQILNLADRYYQSADRGMHFLPLQARLAILVASRLYQAKGTTIRRNPHLYLKKRADVPFLGKIYHTLRAFYSYCLDPACLIGRKTAHDASLHRDLLFLPATNPP